MATNHLRHGIRPTPGQRRLHNFQPSQRDLPPPPYPTPSHQATAATLDLRTSAWSPAALEFIGFAPAAIFAHLSFRPAPETSYYGLLDYAESHVQSKDIGDMTALRTRELMAAMGLNGEVQAALLDPRFAEVATTETLQFWIKDSLRVNWDALMELRKRLRDRAETWVIRIQLPKAVVDGLKTEELWWDSAAWKEYVWCRRGESRGPRRFDKYWKYGQTELMKGHVSTGVAARVRTEEREEFRAETMRGDNVLKLESGEKCQQWIFMQDGSADLVDKEARGKVHVDVTAAARMQGKTVQEGWTAGL